MRSSLSTLYLILASVALLAAFFSSDAAEAYIDRDRSDIKTLWILGLSVSQIRNIYFRITLLSVFSALLAGTVLGLGLSALSPFILKAVAYSVPALLEYYVTSFSISVPLLPLLAMMLLSLAVSAFSVALSLRKIGS